MVIVPCWSLLLYIKGYIAETNERGGREFGIVEERYERVWRRKGEEGNVYQGDMRCQEVCHGV